MPRFNERRGGDRRQDDNRFYDERGRGWPRHDDGPWSPYNGGKRSFERTHPHDERRFDSRGREYWRENEDESPREWSERDDGAQARPSGRWDDRREPDRDRWGYGEHLHDPLAEEDELWGNEMGTPADQPSGRSIPRGPDWQSEPRSGETWIARDEHFRGPGGFHRDARDYGRDMRRQREPRDYGRDMRGQHEPRDYGREMRGQHEQRDVRDQREQRDRGREMRGHEQRYIGGPVRDPRDYGRDMRGQRDFGGERSFRGDRDFSRDMRAPRDFVDDRDIRPERDVRHDRRDAGHDLRRDQRGYTDEPGRDLGAFQGDEGSMSRREYGIEGRDFRAEQSHELRRDRGEPWHGSETRGSDEYGRGLEQRTPEDRFRPENREWAARISGRGDRRRR